MSLITYVLLCALTYGNAGQFNPEVIPDVCTKCFLANIVEVVAIRVGFYMMQTSVPFFDLFAYPGCGRLAAAVTAGLQASAVFVLVVSLVNPGSSYTSRHWLHCFYVAIAVLVGVCWLGFQRLMTHSQDVYRSMLRRDSSIQLSSFEINAGVDENDNDDDQESTTDYHRVEEDPSSAAIIAQANSSLLHRLPASSIAGPGFRHRLPV